MNERVRRIFAKGKARTQCVYCGREGQLLEAGTWYCGDGCRTRVELMRERFRAAADAHREAKQP